MHTKTFESLRLTLISAVSLLTVALLVSNAVANESTLHSAAFQQSPSENIGTGSGALPALGTLVHALEQKDANMKRTITVHVHPTDATGSSDFEWSIAIADHPDLLKLSYGSSFATYGIDQKKLAAMIAKDEFKNELAMVSPMITSTFNDGYVTRVASGTLIARDGYAYDADSLASQISDAFSYGNNSVSIDAAYRHATVSLQEADGLHTLTLLGNGISDDSDSPVDRIWNVHKAIDERVNGIVIKPGDTFSFVAALGGPVTLQKGWRMELGLFGGGAAMTPGAGICQAATTTFRAALLSGLPIIERRNHSEWVPHYAIYGAGLDATVFPGFHDLRFKNNTGDDIVFQSYIVGTTVYVHIYGKADGRTVTLDGPYFSNSPHRPAALRPLGSPEVGWTYTVSLAGGESETQALIANYYKGIPRSTKTKYSSPVGISILHDGAPQNLRPGN